MIWFLIYSLNLGRLTSNLIFETIYAISKQGIAKTNLEDEGKDLVPLLDLIIDKVKPASSKEANDKPLLMQPFNLAYDDFLGRLAVSRIYEGQVNSGDNVIIKKRDGSTAKGKITKLFVFKGVQREEVTSAQEGDIVIIVGSS